MFKKLFRTISIATLLLIPTAWYVDKRVTKALDDLQESVESRALPVLRKDIPILNKSFMGIPSAQSMLSYINLGPLSPGKLTQKAVGVIEQPIIKRKLEHTKQALNQELCWVKIKDMTFARDGKYKTLTAHCSYGITVVITGKKFKKVNSRERKHLALTFTCD